MVLMISGAEYFVDSEGEGLEYCHIPTMAFEMMSLLFLMSLVHFTSVRRGTTLSGSRATMLDHIPCSLRWCLLKSHS